MWGLAWGLLRAPPAAVDFTGQDEDIEFSDVADELTPESFLRKSREACEVARVRGNCSAGGTACGTTRREGYEDDPEIGAQEIEERREENGAERRGEKRLREEATAAEMNEAHEADDSQQESGLRACARAAAGDA